MKATKKLNSILYNHLWLKKIFDYATPFLGSVISAAIFAFGLTVFIQPDTLGVQATSMVSGGASGLAQVIKALIGLFKRSGFKNHVLIYNIIYFLVNAPLLVLAYFGVGKRFSIFTLVNVGCVVLFNFLFTIDGTPLAKGLVEISNNVITQGGGTLSRALFAGICTGLSSAIAFKVDSSAGGFDILSYYIANKKSALAGKYGMIINGLIIGSFALVSGIDTRNFATSVIGVCFSIIYLLTVMLVIDVINIRNKKAQIQIITSNKELPKLLLANIPHGATVAKAKGVFTEDDKLIIYMVVSTTEIKRSVNVIKELDPNSFINVSALIGVYGKFHMKPIK